MIDIDISVLFAVLVGLIVCMVIVVLVSIAQDDEDYLSFLDLFFIVLIFDIMFICLYFFERGVK